MLAVAGATSLAYDIGRPPPSSKVSEAALALKDLSSNARFFSNGLWGADNRGWCPLTAATFDCGVIGYDAESAFIFWVEEED